MHFLTTNYSSLLEYSHDFLCSKACSLERKIKNTTSMLNMIQWCFYYNDIQRIFLRN